MNVYKHVYMCKYMYTYVFLIVLTGIYTRKLVIKEYTTYK